MKHTIELQPFMVPNFARPVAPIGKREDGWTETPAIPLSELSTETLEALCAEFRDGVFKKAGKVPNVELRGAARKTWKRKPCRSPRPSRAQG